jgi:hypothetical protein
VSCKELEDVFMSRDPSQCLLAFDSTQQALRAEMLLDYQDLEIDTQPTPKEITAGCAISIAFLKEDFFIVKKTMLEEQVEVRGFFQYQNGNYHEISIETELM